MLFAIIFRLQLLNFLLLFLYSDGTKTVRDFTLHSRGQLFVVAVGIINTGS